MFRVTSVTQLPEALQASKRAKTGVQDIQKNGVWIVGNDSSDTWKMVTVIGTFCLLGTFVWWIPGTGGHTPPAWFLAIWTTCGLAVTGICYWGAWHLSGNSAIAARIDPGKGIVIFSRREGKLPVRVAIDRCFVQIRHEVTTESPVARVGMPLGKNFPEFVHLMIGTALTPGRDQQQATLAIRLPYREVALGLAPLLELGAWAGIALIDSEAALRETVMSQVRHVAGTTPIYIPRRAAEVMFVTFPYRVYDPPEK